MRVKSQSVADFISHVHDIDLILGYCVQAYGAKAVAAPGLYQHIIDEAAKTPIGKNQEAIEELKRSNEEVITQSSLIQVVQSECFEIKEKKITIGSEDFGNSCPICLDRESEIVMPCMHSYCNTCINDW